MTKKEQIELAIAMQGAAQPDPKEEYLRAINDVSQYAFLSEDDYERLGIEF